MGSGKNAHSVGTVVLSFFIGTVIGAGVALLLAPRKERKRDGKLGTRGECEGKKQKAPLKK